METELRASLGKVQTLASQRESQRANLCVEGDATSNDNYLYVYNSKV